MGYVIEVEKQLGSWIDDGPCVGIGDDTFCGPGNQKQTRTCIDGTIEKCTSYDTEQIISCNLPDCIKRLGNWTNTGVCEATGNDASCGPGNQNQTRTCSDGTTDKCTPTDRERTISCNLPNCIKILGTWTNKTVCEATGKNSSCGPGNQKQTRVCMDGTIDKCTTTDRERTIPCNLPDCIKQVGSWNNDGVCESSSEEKSCGPGNQRQTRTCTNGTTEICTDSDIARTVSCSDVGTRLPKCPGKDGYK